MLESRPVRWKKYSFPSSAAMKPKPRSETNFLMVPVGIPQLLFSKANRERTGPFEKIGARRTSPTTRGQNYLTTGLKRQQRHPGERRGGPRQLQRPPSPLAQAPHAPDRDGHDRELANGGDHGERRQAERPEDEEVAGPEEEADHSRLAPARGRRRGLRSISAQRRGKPYRDQQPDRHQHEQQPGVEPGRGKPNPHPIHGGVGGDGDPGHQGRQRGAAACLRQRDRDDPDQQQAHPGKLRRSQALAQDDESDRDAEERRRAAGDRVYGGQLTPAIRGREQPE